MGAAITAAFTAAETNVGLVTAGIITLTALVTGISLVVSLLRK